jgi:hypothetical protein
MKRERKKERRRGVDWLTVMLGGVHLGDVGVPAVASALDEEWAAVSGGDV